MIIIHSCKCYVYMQYCQPHFLWGKGGGIKYSQDYSSDIQCTSMRPGVILEAGDPLMMVVLRVIQYLNNHTPS